MLKSKMIARANHLVTLLVRWTGLLAEMDFGSALAIVRVYMSENLGSFEDTINPVLLNDPCVPQKHDQISKITYKNILQIRRIS